MGTDVRPNIIVNYDRRLLLQACASLSSYQISWTLAHLVGENYDFFMHFGSCFVLLFVLLHAWIGPVHCMKSCLTGMVESMNLRPFMAQVVWQYCNLDHHISSLEDHRWVKRLMQWRHDVCGRGGRRPTRALKQKC